MNLVPPPVSSIPMRRSLSLALVLLLLLRGLLGNAMAMGAAPMVIPAFQASPTASQLHHHTPLLLELADGAHHAEHAAHATQHAVHEASCASPPDSHSGSCAEHEHGPGCTLCGICHSALSTPGQLPQGGLSPASALRPQDSERFASATKLQAIKPPIS